MKNIHEMSVEENRNMNQIIMIGAWSITLVISSLLYMYAGRQIDAAMSSEPFFMIGLFVLGITLCIIRMYKDFQAASHDLARIKHHHI